MMRFKLGLGFAGRGSHMRAPLAIAAPGTHAASALPIPRDVQEQTSGGCLMLCMPLTVPWPRDCAGKTP